MYIIVGLGNPTKEYNNTRHNIGFDVIDKLADMYSISVLEKEVFESNSAKIIVYYPTEDDTLFSVAKRYRTSVLKVARDNGISESVFSSENPEGKLLGVKKLVIY